MLDGEMVEKFLEADAAIEERIRKSEKAVHDFTKRELAILKSDLVLMFRDAAVINVVERLQQTRGDETPIRELGLSVRTVNCLRSEGIFTLGRLKTFSVLELRKIPNLGKKSEKEIATVARLCGIKLPDAHKDPAGDGGA